MAMHAWMAGGLLMVAAAGAGGGYYRFMMRTPDATALCEHIVRQTLAVPASYERTASETASISGGTSTILQFDALTRGGEQRSMVAECKTSLEMDTLWRLPESIHVNVNGEDIPDDFARAYAQLWAVNRDGKNVDPAVSYQRAMQIADEALKSSKKK